MNRALFLLFIFMTPQLALGAVASTQYVKGATETKVDTSASANQTLEGTYTVSGTLTVPTPPLPAAN